MTTRNYKSLLVSFSASAPDDLYRPVSASRLPALGSCERRYKFYACFHFYFDMFTTFDLME